MSFLHPEFLYFMLPPLVLLFALLLTQKESHAELFSDEVMAKLRVSANTLTLQARNGLFFLIGILLIVALAQPVIEEGSVEVKAKSSDITIALDISDSMLAEDVYPNRLELSRQKALELLKDAPNERIGVVAFAKNSYLVSPLSFDHDAVAFLLRELKTSSMSEKGTDFISLLEVVAKSAEEGKKYLLILSDGGDNEDFSNEIAYAKEHEIVVFVIGVGSLKGAPIKQSDGSFIKYKGEIVVSKLNEKIADLATKSGGVYIESVNSNADIKRMVAEMMSLENKKDLKSKEIKRYIPLFYYPLGLSLLLLLIATSSMSKRQNVQVPSGLILALLLANAPYSHAGLLDFMDLQKAKEAYEKGEFSEAAAIYESHAKSAQNPQSHFNAGNAYYKMGDYDKAIEHYEKATGATKQESANILANLASSHAKKGTREELQKSLEYYENSLKLHEDKATREDYETVKRLLEEQKQDQQSNKDQNKQEDEQKSSQDSKEGDSKSQKEENQKSDAKDSNRSEESKNKEQNGQERDQKASDEMNQSTPQKEEPQKAEELQEQSATKAQTKSRPKEMSESEEQKWMQLLENDYGSFMYRLSDDKPKEDRKDEKPW